MSAPDTILTLGDFEFASMEIPSEISFGGTQRTATHELVGGIRVIDVMGRSDRDLEWSGYFLGSEAADRAQYLDGLRVAGKALSLEWAQFSYSVIVRDFQADYKRAFEIPYKITCQVITDNTSPVTTAPSTPVDDQMADDLDDSNTLSGLILDPTLAANMATVTTAVGAVTTFANAPQSTINSVLAPLAAAQVQIAALINPLNASMGAVSGFGGVIAGDPAASADSLNAQISASLQLTNLYQMRGLTGRMIGNLNAIDASAGTVATAGGNLFAIASQEYGDAMAWTGIAKANGLTDPFIQGTSTLTIPAQADTQDGVLGS